MTEAEVIPMTVALLSLEIESEAIKSLLFSTIGGVFFVKNGIFIFFSILPKPKEKVELVFFGFGALRKLKKRLLI